MQLVQTPTRGARAPPYAAVSAPEEIWSLSPMTRALSPEANRAFHPLAEVWDTAYA
ncbi:hypothetical protein [Streptomyces sp. NPDC001889]